jgi:hypothetical protein
MTLLNRSVALLFLTMLIFNCSKAQSDSSETDTHIFWTHDRELSMEDFQQEDPPDKYSLFCDSINLCWGAATGFYSALDVPKRRRDKKTKYEEVYFAAAFDKTLSYRMNDDTLQFELQKLMFDLQELVVRLARRDLQALYDSMPAIGTKSIWFNTVKARAEKFHKSKVAEFTYEIYILNLEGAYDKWKKYIEDGLEETKEYQSTFRDTYRFVKGRPIKPKYEEAKRVLGNLYEN